MLSKFWFCGILYGLLWEDGTDNLAEFILKIIFTVFLALIGLIFIPLDILLSPLYFLFWLLSFVKFN